MTSCDLSRLSEDSLGKLDIEKLTDILDVDMTGDTAGERFISFIEQVGNPYCYKVGKTPVRIMFKLGDRPIEEKLREHFLSLKRGS